MVEKNYKTMDDIIMERIFDIEDGSYSINTSIGILVVEKKTLKDSYEEYLEDEVDYYEKEVLVNIYKNDKTIFSKYYYKTGNYQFNKLLGGHENPLKYCVDYPGFELFNNINIDIYGYGKPNDYEVIIYLDEDKNKVCYIKDDIVKINEEKYIPKKWYKITNNLIYDNAFKYIKIDINTGAIFIELNGSFIKFDKDENIISKLSMYSDKMEELEEYIEKNIKDIKDIINFDCNLKIGDKYLVNENSILDQINDLKNIKELYNEGIKLLDYEHDVKIKREIANGLNGFCKKRIGAEEDIIVNNSIQNKSLINKLIKLDNGYYFFNTSYGLVEIDVNLYEGIEVIYNENDIIFKMRYGKVICNANVREDFIAEINNKVNKELAKQDKINKHNEKIEKQNEIKKLEKRLKELKNN